MRCPVTTTAMSPCGDLPIPPPARDRGVTLNLRLGADWWR
jgi:hypothetical protein